MVLMSSGVTVGSMVARYSSHFEKRLNTLYRIHDIGLLVELLDDGGQFGELVAETR
jgi:hypothetical protein